MHTRPLPGRAFPNAPWPNLHSRKAHKRRERTVNKLWTNVEGATGGSFEHSSKARFGWLPRLRSAYCCTFRAAHQCLTARSGRSLIWLRLLSLIRALRTSTVLLHWELTSLFLWDKIWAFLLAVWKSFPFLMWNLKWVSYVCAPNLKDVCTKLMCTKIGCLCTKNGCLCTSSRC